MTLRAGRKRRARTARRAARSRTPAIGSDATAEEKDTEVEQLKRDLAEAQWKLRQIEENGADIYTARKIESLLEAAQIARGQAFDASLARNRAESELRSLERAIMEARGPSGWLLRRAARRLLSHSTAGARQLIAGRPVGSAAATDVGRGAERRSGSGCQDAGDAGPPVAEHAVLPEWRGESSSERGAVELLPEVIDEDERRKLAALRSEGNGVIKRIALGCLALHRDLETVYAGLDDAVDLRRTASRNGVIRFSSTRTSAGGRRASLTACGSIGVLSITPFDLCATVSSATKWSSISIAVAWVRSPSWKFCGFGNVSTVGTNHSRSRSCYMALRAGPAAQGPEGTGHRPSTD